MLGGVDLMGKTAEDALAALRLAVEEKGEDYVYTTPDGRQPTTTEGILCSYVHPDGPGCIAGNVLHRWGVPLDVLANFEGDSIASLGDGRLASAPLPGQVADVLRAAQVEQDCGRTWGEALHYAEKYAERP